MTQPRGQQPAAAADLLGLAESAEPFIAVMGSTRAKFMAEGWEKSHAEEATLLLYKFALKATGDDTPGQGPS